MSASRTSARPRLAWAHVQALRARRGDHRRSLSAAGGGDRGAAGGQERRRRSSGAGDEDPGHRAASLDDVDGGGPQTILVLGSDRRFVDIKAKNPARSDTIMLVRLDPSQGRDRGDVDPARPQGRRSPATARTRSTRPTRSAGRASPSRRCATLLRIPINHVVNVNFGGFRRAVDRLGCVYVDVDRRYFNDNHPPFGAAATTRRSTSSAGYQKLCGQDALDYVRYRHVDTDFVRAARQQDFLRQAKDQIGVGKLFGDRKALLKIFGTLHADRHPLPTRRSCGCSSSRSSRPSTRSSEVHFRRRGSRARRTSRSPRTRSTARSRGVPQRRRARAGPREHATAGQAPQRKRRSGGGPAPGRASRQDRGRGLGVADASTDGASRSTTRSRSPAARQLPRATDRRAYDIYDRGQAPLPRLPDGRQRRRHRPVLRRPGHDLDARRRSSTTRRRRARSAAASTSCSSTATGCGSSPGAPSGPSTGSPTRCSQTLTNRRCSGIARSLTRVGR